MKRVMVIGGGGFYGARVVERLRALPGLEVRVASRRTEPRLDLHDPDSFCVLDEVDATLNVSDSVGAPPDAALRRVLTRGGIWLEAGADPTALERLLALRAEGLPGTALLGVGVFPGLSTALAAEAIRVGPAPASVELGVRLSPLSGAGPANVDLMMASLETPGLRWVRGQRRVGPSVGEGAPMPFPGAEGAVAPAIALPDGPLIHRLAPQADVTTRLAPTPSFLRFSFAALARLLQVAGPLAGPLRAALRWQLLLTRALVLRGVQSPLQLVVVVDRGAPSERTRWLALRDGQDATAIGAAAVTALALEAEALPAGIHGVCEALDPAEILARARALGLG